MSRKNQKEREKMFDYYNWIQEEVKNELQGMLFKARKKVNNLIFQYSFISFQVDHPMNVMMK